MFLHVYKKSPASQEAGDWFAVHLKVRLTENTRCKGLRPHPSGLRSTQVTGHCNRDVSRLTLAVI